MVKLQPTCWSGRFQVPEGKKFFEGECIPELDQLEKLFTDLNDDLYPHAWRGAVVCFVFGLTLMVITDLFALMVSTVKNLEVKSPKDGKKCFKNTFSRRNSFLGLKEADSLKSSSVLIYKVTSQNINAPSKWHDARNDELNLNEDGAD